MPEKLTAPVPTPSYEHLRTREHALGDCGPACPDNIEPFASYRLGELDGAADARQSCYIPRRGEDFATVEDSDAYFAGYYWQRYGSPAEWPVTI